MSPSATEKLARFLLDFRDGRTETDGCIYFNLESTHQDIADMIGVSRETVCRLFAKFERRGLVERRDSRLLVVRKEGLRDLLRRSG